LFYTDRLTDWRADMTKLTVILCNFKNAPEVTVLSWFLASKTFIHEKIMFQKQTQHIPFHHCPSWLKLV
jgi:hypothetical protein